MKKSILNLVGAQELSKNEQKNVNGGKQYCGPTFDGYASCPTGTCCMRNGTFSDKGVCEPCLIF